MKKIGIATLHYSDNYGAVLQAWALRKIINRMPECECKIINYVPEGFGYMPCDGSEDTRRRLLEKRHSFERFFLEQMDLKEPICRSITGEGIDYICVGSDQVWNFTFNHTRNFEYLLPNASDQTIKFSYAASIGLPVTDASRYEKQFRESLCHFKNISVREDEHVKFVENITGQECTCVLDPTLLLNSEEYSFLSSDKAKELKNKRYLFLFWLHNKDYFSGIELANRIAIKYNLQIIHSFPNLKEYTFFKDGGYMNYCGIEEFLDYIRYAKCVVTNSYHVTVFSLHMKVPFYIWPVKEMSSRVTALVNNFDIEKRVVRKYISSEDITTEMSFEGFENNISELRKKSLCYLKGALDE